MSHAPFFAFIRSPWAIELGEKIIVLQIPENVLCVSLHKCIFGSRDTHMILDGGINWIFSYVDDAHRKFTSMWHLKILFGFLF